jgi:8-oxo-dGTP pyrophosphatase MutT (NUDIX family)
MYPVWNGSEWVDLPAAESGGEVVVVPNVAAVVLRAPDRDALLMQRRDKSGEAVRGRIELPGGRWRAGEAPDAAVAREVAEETGVTVLAVSGAIGEVRFGDQVACRVAHPVAVVSGIDGAYPSLHVLFECLGTGEPRDVQGETVDARWWPPDDVEAQLRDQPNTFVWQTRAMLGVWLAGRRPTAQPT